MAYEQNYTQSTGSTVNGGELDASSHAVEMQSTMAEDMNTVPGDDLYNFLENWDTADGFSHGECRERAFCGSVV